MSQVYQGTLPLWCPHLDRLWAQPFAILTYSGSRGFRLECQQCGSPILQTASAAPSYVYTHRLQSPFAIVGLSICHVLFTWATPHSPPTADSLFWQGMLRETAPTMSQFGQVGLSASWEHGRTHESVLPGMHLSNRACDT